MPSGNQHTVIALTAAAITLGASYWLDYTGEGIAVAIGVLIGDAWLSPDLDGFASNAKRRWWLLKWIWKPYERFPHRSPFTHFPILGDVIRLAYLAIIGLIICAGFGLAHDGVQGMMLDTFWMIDMAKSLILSYPHEALCLFSGLSLATLLHGLADAIVSEGKKMIDNKPRKRKKSFSGSIPDPRLDRSRR